jgi:hypothetical protein
MQGGAGGTVEYGIGRFGDGASVQFDTATDDFRAEGADGVALSFELKGGQGGSDGGDASSASSGQANGESVVRVFDLAIGGKGGARASSDSGPASDGGSATSSAVGRTQGVGDVEVVAIALDTKFGHSSCLSYVGTAGDWVTRAVSATLAQRASRSDCSPGPGLARSP